jgi:hypothetical protein
MPWKYSCGQLASRLVVLYKILHELPKCLIFRNRLIDYYDNNLTWRQLFFQMNYTLWFVLSFSFSCCRRWLNMDMQFSRIIGPRATKVVTLPAPKNSAAATTCVLLIGPPSRPDQETWDVCHVREPLPRHSRQLKAAATAATWLRRGAIRR